MGENLGVGCSWGIVQYHIHQTDHFNGFDSTKEYLGGRKLTQ